MNLLLFIRIIRLKFFARRESNKTGDENETNKMNRMITELIGVKRNVKAERKLSEN